VALKRASAIRSASCRHFGLSEPFQSYVSDAAVIEARDLRDQVVHRGRPSYRESPSFRRRSVWRGGHFKIEFPSNAELDADAPSIADRRQVVIRCGVALFDTSTRPGR